MPKLELSFTITAIVALMSLLSPIITTLLNNRHQLKIRKLELDQKQSENTVLYMRNIFENYVSALGKLPAYPTNEALAEYGKYYSLAYMYLPENLQSDMSDINILVLEHIWDRIPPLLEKLIPKINKVLQTM
jgi:hypothetical protein